MDSLDYSEELRHIADEYKQYAFEYKRARAEHAEALNQLTSLIYKAGLHSDKASFENKLTKLLATKQAATAYKYIEQLNTSRAEYKGLEMVCDSYKAQISAIQSVIKFNLQGEVQQAIVNKYERNETL